VSNLDAVPATPSSTDRATAIQRLLFVADAAVAEVRELPPAARTVIDAAAGVYVLTPSLPGRLAWLADDVDRCRHVADERLDTVLGHMHSIGAEARGLAGRGSILTVVADAVAEFAPDHILLALRSSEHANWQEHRLVEHIEDRFGLPVTTYAVDVRGHTGTADGPLLLCWDGSADAAHAMERAGALFPGRSALVLTVWQQQRREDAGRLVAEGVRVADRAGLSGEPLAVERAGPVWKTILDVADRHDVAAVVMGSRGLTGLRSMLLGSVSSAVVGHADRPTLVVRHAMASPTMSEETSSSSETPGMPA
jgi:nucleotide-binding universal stress UspA family protein